MICPQTCRKSNGRQNFCAGNLGHHQGTSPAQSCLQLAPVPFPSLLLLPAPRSFSRLEIQDAAGCAGGRWGERQPNLAGSGGYFWPGSVPRSLPFAASFPPPTAPLQLGRRSQRQPRGDGGRRQS